MNASEHQDAGRTVTRRRHVIVARKRPADLNAAPATSTASTTSEAARDIPATIGDTRMMTSEQLFAGQNAVAIRHNGAIYTLRVTRFGKLILTK
ncbi:hemin uptake protein HemP [Ralstonia sp. CHL-2022]|uniref:Hemin uptake protein HemP n=1 Tax=Ralstonia mojiangensis TaxID=2953895 RepID=A0AAE3LD52_9RALS|nr:hemin uptake protein HemP [Ralstonia mojiangensis]MCT7295382.1 hemin uptake protein HemP [Ralstonia mojiangensis]MCT7313625.1 hemin uptake protein HemP [Ralstonia mojiangensis]MCT7316206.1 hemin uptake protein HemP [Ralstonia mojiangensis]MCT7325367.1 hemin uptake protein HemP [Ralstonia mojiangensis]